MLSVLPPTPKGAPNGILGVRFFFILVILLVVVAIEN
jgi:hypothetical protein